MLCYGCHSLIDEPDYLVIVDRCWHLSCLKCIDCGMLLEQESTCFSKREDVFCKQDYIKRFCSTRCTRCYGIIRPDDLVLRAEQFIFHLNCFTCIICDNLLQPGDDYGLIDSLIFCHDHLFYHESYDSHKIFDDSGYHTSPNETHQLKMCQHENEENFLRFSLELSSSSDYIDIHNNSSNKMHIKKHKRLRTSFKHHQLRCMKSYFNINHNPDAKDLKNLSEKVNLSKRVLQVWFQNARAKFRRSNTLPKEVQINLLSNSNSSDL